MSAPPDVLDAARSGDAEAFERLVGPYRGELLAHCYRMLGSFHDAEDDAIRVFLTEGPLRSRWRFLPTSANGQLAFGTYLWDDDAGAYIPGGLDVLTIQNGRVAEIVAFLSADFAKHGLPARLL